MWKSLTITVANTQRTIRTANQQFTPNERIIISTTQETNLLPQGSDAPLQGTITPPPNTNLPLQGAYPPLLGGNPLK